MNIRLEAPQIIQTAEKLHARIGERFPGSGLSKVADQLHQISKLTAKRAERIQRPNILLRLLAVALVGTLILIGYGVAQRIDPKTIAEHTSDVLDFVQFVESSLGAIVFLGAAVLFVVTWESRLKRNRAIDAIYELRSLAHIVDMHQLTKDPERVCNPTKEATPSSPERKMTPFELGRYLDYCSELLSLISKVAVLYVQGVKDDDVLDAVDQIETLTTGLSRKIWQKIALLDRLKNRASGSMGG